MSAHYAAIDTLMESHVVIKATSSKDIIILVYFCTHQNVYFSNCKHTKADFSGGL